MKKQIYAYLIALLLLCGCVTQPYTPPVIRKIAPEIEYIAIQAKNTTTSAERTVEFAKVVDTKYKGDKDAYNTVKSAEETVIESKKTEQRAAETQKRAEKLDKDAQELEGKYNSAAKEVGQLKKDKETMAEKIKSLGKTIWNQRFIIIGLGAALVAAIALVVKPWKWFI